MIDDAQQAELLRIARTAVLNELQGSKAPVPASMALPQVGAGLFVTIRNGTRLRGCMGAFGTSGSLAETIDSIARSSARDPRFATEPITVDEMGDVTIEVSLLTPLVQLERLDDLCIGTHGVFVQHGKSTGCFLPKVAVEHGWSAEEFLDQCCKTKAELPAGTWKDPNCSVYTFRADVIKE